MLHWWDVNLGGPELIHLKDGKSVAPNSQLLFAPMAGIINRSQHSFLVSQDATSESLST